MKIEVLTTQWAHDGGVLPGGVHEIDKPSKKLLEQAALAESVGSIKVSASTDERAKMRAAVEPDSESVKKQNAAIEDESWHVGNLGDYIATRTALLGQHTDPDDPLELDDGTRTNVEAGVEQAKAILKRVEGGEKYSGAVTAVLRG